ncbi:hypothetical protein MNV49_007016 [Pseudohyphozyma bogoriensis]|nr:hypothetical protein MNV49_007016 [Pseudohyphozyma bogoriensis]
MISRPGNKVITKKKLQSRKGATHGSKLHPNSRRAKQLQRVELREKKLDTQSKVRRSAEVGRIDRHIYFVHSIPEDRTSLSLPELHKVLTDYIARNDDEAQELKAEREGRAWRKGEGMNKREKELAMQKEAEESEYRSGFVVPDLTIAQNVFIARQWTSPAPTSSSKTASAGGDPSFFPRVRLIRIFSEDQNMVVVEREGARKEGEWAAGEGEVEMGEDEEEEDDEEEE